MTKNDDKKTKKPEDTEEDSNQVQDEKQNEEVEKEEDQTQKRVQELEEKYKRALADYQNLEKRTHEERINWIHSANKTLLLRLLPILDTLQMAQQHSTDKSLQVSIAQFLDVLKGEGIEQMQAIGKEFDPTTMECVVTEEVDPSTGFHSDDESSSERAGQGEGKVVAELRIGYFLNGVVLRPAQVKVGRKE